MRDRSHESYFHDPDGARKIKSPYILPPTTYSNFNVFKYESTKIGNETA